MGRMYFKSKWRLTGEVGRKRTSAPKAVAQIVAVTPYGSLSAEGRLPLLLEWWEV